MPSASVRTATAVKAGLLRSWRSANLRSAIVAPLPDESRWLAYIRSGASMPSRSSPRASTSAVSAQSASRESRVAASGARSGLGERDARAGDRRLDTALARLAENRADPRVRVLQIRPGVALGREHPLPVEHVVLDAVVREVGVLYGADADRGSERAPLGCVALNAALDVALRELGVGSFDRLVEQIDESHDLARPRLERLLVLPEHRAEGDLLGARRRLEPTGDRCNREHHREVLRLRRADDVEQARGA